VIFSEIELSHLAKRALQVDFILDLLVMIGSPLRCTSTSHEALQDQQPSDEKADGVEKADRAYKTRFKLQGAT
jgi:hypothetical protein